MKRNFNRALVVVAGLSMAASSFAAGTGSNIDTSSVTEALTAAGAAIAVVGAAYLAMTVGAKVFKWIKTAL